MNHPPYFLSKQTCRMAGLFALLLLVGMQLGFAGEAWKAKLHEEIPLLGHRNWIVVVDSAYPWQVAPGVETIETGDDILDVCKTVLDELSKTKHVRPDIYTDLELAKLPEADAPGVTAYRDGLAKVLKGHQVQTLLHEKLIGQLDEAGKTFHVLILKTNLTIPYTSVFMRLLCGYWPDDASARLRTSMGTEGQ